MRRRATPSFGAEVTAADQRDADSVPNNGDPDEDDQNQVSLTGRPTDLALAVSASETAPGFGEAVTFTVVLDNQSAVDATGVAVAAALPAGYAFVSATPSQGAYADGTWTVGGVAGGASATLQVVATARTLDASTFSAQVAAASPTDADSQPGNDDDTEDDQDAVAVQARPTDLALALAASDPAPGVGEETTLTLTLDNQSTVGATGVAVRLPVPSGYTVVSTAPSQGSYDAETGAWTVGAVAGSGQATLAVVLRAKALAPASVTAEITAADQPDADSQPGNGDDDEDDQATATLTPQPIDLALTASADDASPALGGTVTYTVTLDNESGAGATGVAVSAALPAGVTFVEATPSQGSYDAETGVWTVGAVAGNGRATLTLTATVASADLGDLVAQVSAADQPDADSAPGNGDDAEDDQARVALAVQAVDLALAVAASDPTPIPGRTITFMVTLANGRATGATGVAVRVPLPAGLAFVSTSGDYDPATGIWTVGAVDGDAAVTLDVVVRVDTASPATVTAEVVAADQPDVDSQPDNGDAAEDDQASATVTPQTVDLALAMTVDEPQPAAGDVVTFVITVTNESTTGATGVQVSSRLIDQPGVAEVVSVTPSVGTFDGSLWLVGALAAGASETLAVAVRLLSDNVAFTHLAEIAAADQPDTDSTPYNGSTFEDDDASATATTGGSSSGGEGGLESDGSLAEAIGQVLFARRAETGALVDAGVALEPVAFSASRSAGASLRRFLPTSGPRGATAVEVSPTDLLPVTNAREIVAADYLRADGRRAGVVFASATAPGEVYEHTKPVCDRLRGAALDAVDLVDVGGRPFVMTRLVQPDGAVDYAVSFVAYGPEEARTVDSRFLLGDYRVPAGGADVLNLQVWSPSPDYTRALVAEVLAALRAESDLTFRNAWTAARAADGDDRQSEGSRPDLPVVFVRAAEYDQGRVRLDLYNAGGARSLRLSGGTLARAEGGGRSDFVRTVEVAPGTPEAPVVPVVVETGFLFDVAFFVETDLSPEPDRLYLADGTWGVAVDRSSDGDAAGQLCRPAPARGGARRGPAAGRAAGPRDGHGRHLGDGLPHVARRRPAAGPQRLPLRRVHGRRRGRGPPPAPEAVRRLGRPVRRGAHLDARAAPAPGLVRGPGPGRRVARVHGRGRRRDLAHPAQRRHDPAARCGRLRAPLRRRRRRPRGAARGAVVVAGHAEPVFRLDAGPVRAPRGAAGPRARVRPAGPRGRPAGGRRARGRAPHGLLQRARPVGRRLRGPAGAGRPRLYASDDARPVGRRGAPGAVASRAGPGDLSLPPTGRSPRLSIFRSAMTRLLALAALVAAGPAIAQADPEIAPADLALTLSTDTAAPAVGEVMTYTVSVRNESDRVNAVGVQVAAPARIGTNDAEFIGATPFQGSFDAGTGLWTVGQVDAGAAAQMLVRIRILRKGDFLGCSEIAAAAQPDPDSTPYSGAQPEDDYACAAVVAR